MGANPMPDRPPPIRECGDTSVLPLFAERTLQYEVRDEGLNNSEELDDRRLSKHRGPSELANGGIKESGAATCFVSMCHLNMPVRASRL